jgi:hypothetical protein
LTLSKPIKGGILMVKRERIISKKYCHFDHGSIKQRVGQGGLGEVVETASTDCKFLVMFSLIYAWPISFKFVYDFIYLSIIEKFSLN